LGPASIPLEAGAENPKGKPKKKKEAYTLEEGGTTATSSFYANAADR
jgi:hypothetical protein